MAGESDSKLNIHLDTESLKSAWSSIGTQMESDAQGVLAATGATMNQVVMAGGAFFRFFGVADSFNETLKLWGYQPLGSKGEKKLTKELSKRRSLGEKLLGTAVYGVHMTATALLATVILGGVVLASPIITAAVSVTALGKNISELYRLQKDVNRLEKDQAELNKELKKANLDFKKNVALYKDLTEARADLHDLKARKEEIDESLKKLAELKKDIDKPEVAEDPEKLKNLTQLIDEATEQYKSKLQGKIRKNFIIGMGEKNQEVPTAGILAQSREKLKELEKQLEKAKADKTDTTKLEEEIGKNTILITHFEKLQKLDKELVALREEKGKLDKIEGKNEVVIKSDGKEEKVDLVALQKQYVDLRIKELEEKLEHKKDPTARFKKVEKLIASHEAVDASGKKENPKERLIALEATLRKGLEAQQENVKGKIEGKAKTLKDKEQYVALFTDDPQKGLQKSLTDLYKIASDNIDKKHELKLAKFERDKKIRHTILAAGVVALSITACVVWPIAATIATVMLGVGAVSLVATIRDTWKKRNMEKENKKEKATEYEKIKNDIGRELGIDDKNTDKMSQTDRLKAVTGSLAKPSTKDNHHDVVLQHTPTHTIQASTPKAKATDSPVPTTAVVEEVSSKRKSQL